MAIYESEHTKFMREWMAKHPQEAGVQQTGRALWWDKPQDLEQAAKYRAARVAQKPYYYDLNNH